MRASELRDELDSSFKTSKVILKWFFGQVEFTRDEFMSLYEMSDHVHEILDKSFVERWVMHYDLAREDPATSIASLETNAEYLETKKKELAGRLSPKQQGLIRLIEELRSQLVVHAKKLKNLKREVDEGNAARSESQFRLSPSDWLPEPLREMRLATYPLIRAMIDLLPGDHPGRDRALETWNAGRTILSERDKDQAQPRWLRGEQTRD